MKHNSLLFILTLIIIYIFAVGFTHLIISELSPNEEPECGPPIISISYAHTNR